MATEKLKLAWHELSPDMFPANVQTAIAKARTARQHAAELTDAADKLLQGFAGRIQVPVMVKARNSRGTEVFVADDSQPRVKLLQDGEEMVISHRFGKLTVASAPKGATASKTKAVLA